MTQVARCVGRYELLDEIGRGGMAIVYRAHQTELRRLVAVKELGALHMPDRSLAQRFVLEARLSGALSHPNVVTVFDFFEHGGIPYIAMEYLPCGSLRPYLRQLTLAQAAGVFQGLLAGLAHAEKEGVVHRDLKPENLMVTTDGHVKIADFGIAKASGDAQVGGFRTATGTAVGTPAYMAPEQAMGREIGPWTDLYAVGVIAFELFTGRVPFSDADAPMAVMLRHIEEPIPPVATLNPTVPAGICDWIARLLVKDPAQRTRCAADAWDELEGLVIDVLGPRWRRHAPLTERIERESDHVKSAVRSGYETFRGGDPLGPAAVIGGPATPPPVGLPAGPMMPSAPAIPVGPSTPLPLDSPTDMPAADAGEPAATDESATVARRPSRAGHEASRPRHRPRPRRRLRALVACAAVPALLGAGMVVARSGGGHDAPSPVPDTALVTSPVAVRVPAGWLPTAAPSATAALALRSPRAAAPAGNVAYGSVTVGLGPASARNASLLRPALTDGLAASARTTIGNLPGGLQAYRYDLRPRGDGRLIVYTAPTSVGVATIACAAPAPATTCERIARSLTVKGATAFPVGASEDYAIRVNRSLRGIAKELARPQAIFIAAKTARRQALAARAIASAFRRGRASLVARPLSPADHSANAALRAAFGRTSDAYRALARAASRHRRAAYERAAMQARRAQAAIAAAITDLTSNGYRGQITARFRRHRIPGLRRPAARGPVVDRFLPGAPPVIIPPRRRVPDTSRLPDVTPKPKPEREKPIFTP